MSPENNANEREALSGQIKFLRILVVGQVLVNLTSLAIHGVSMVREHTIVVPPEVRRAYEVGVNYASNDYLLDMAGYVLDKVLNVTPETVDYNNRVISKMAHPDGYANLKTFLDAAGLRLKKERVTTIWIPHKENVDMDAKSVVISGEIKTFIADNLISKKDKSYLVQFIVTLSGRLYVSRIEEVTKHDPNAAHTAN